MDPPGREPGTATAGSGKIAPESKSSLSDTNIPVAPKAGVRKPGCGRHAGFDRPEYCAAKRLSLTL